MSKWAVVTLLVIGAHFSASYLVPLDEQAQKTFLGLLRWAWPWAYGDRGPLGALSAGPSGFPIGGFFLAAASGGLFILAALAALHWWIPFGWWRHLAVAGAALQLALMALFLGATKVLPIGLDVCILYVLLNRDLALPVH